MSDKEVDRVTEDISNFLVNIACVKYGFCISREDRRALERCRSMTAEEFIGRLYEFEGVRVDEQLSVFKALVKEFKQKFGERV